MLMGPHPSQQILQVFTFCSNETLLILVSVHCGIGSGTGGTLFKINDFTLCSIGVLHLNQCVALVTTELTPIVWMLHWLDFYLYAWKILGYPTFMKAIFCITFLFKSITCYDKSNQLLRKINTFQNNAADGNMIRDLKMVLFDQN